MAVVETEISVFNPGSRKANLQISSLIPRQVIDVLAEKLGTEAGKKAENALRTMDRNDMDFVQFRLGDKRVRIKQG